MPNSLPTLSAGGFQKGLHEQVSEFFSDDDARNVYANVFSHQAPDIRAVFLGFTEVFFAEVDTRAARLPELHKLDTPTKIIFGADDPYLNAELAREFHEILPNSILHLVQGGGHYVQHDQPDEVARLILSAPRS